MKSLYQNTAHFQFIKIFYYSLFLNSYFRLSQTVSVSVSVLTLTFISGNLNNSILKNKEFIKKYNLVFQWTDGMPFAIHWNSVALLVGQKQPLQPYGSSLYSSVLLIYSLDFTINSIIIVIFLKIYPSWLCLKPVRARTYPSTRSTSLNANPAGTMKWIFTANWSSSLSSTLFLFSSSQSLITRSSGSSGAPPGWLFSITLHPTIDPIQRGHQFPAVMIRQQPPDLGMLHVITTTTALQVCSCLFRINPGRIHFFFADGWEENSRICVFMLCHCQQWGDFYSRSLLFHWKTGLHAVLGRVNRSVFKLAIKSILVDNNRELLLSHFEC